VSQLFEIASISLKKIDPFRAISVNPAKLISSQDYLEESVISPVYLRRRDAARYLREHWGLPCSEKYLAKLACVGGGPVYRRANKTPLYTTSDLDEYATRKISKPVRSTSEYEVER
jgi:hypothetical protein